MPDNSEERLDAALRTRSVTTAPPEFTAAVIRRVAGAPLHSPISTFWTREGLALGLILFGMGLSLVIDVNRLGLWLQQALQAPSPIMLAALALSFSAAWLTTSEAT